MKLQGVSLRTPLHSLFREASGPILLVKKHCTGVPAGDHGQVLVDAQEIFSERMNLTSSSFHFHLWKGDIIMPSSRLLGGLSENICKLLSMTPKPTAGTQYMFIVAANEGDISSNLVARVAPSDRSCFHLCRSRKGPHSGPGTPAG